MIENYTGCLEAVHLAAVSDVDIVALQRAAGCELRVVGYVALHGPASERRALFRAGRSHSLRRL